MNHETLAQALDIFGGFEAWMKSFSTPKSVEESQLAEAMSVLAAAARKTLAQLPEKCPICRGNSGPASDTSCETCNERGVLYPPALVERIAKAIVDDDLDNLSPVFLETTLARAVAVLDALNTETP